MQKQFFHDMEGHAKKCVERNCELANKTNQQFYKVATPCMDDHQFEEEENESVGELSTKEGKALYFAAILDVGHLKNSEFMPQFQKIKVEFYSEVTL